MGSFYRDQWSFQELSIEPVIYYDPTTGVIFVIDVTSLKPAWIAQRNALDWKDEKTPFIAVFVVGKCI